jgi:Na+/H+ antiporter NhaD/arsenite permease-like protein
VREAPPGPREAIRVEGAQNVLYLGGVLAAVVLSGTWRLGEVRIFGVPQRLENLLRDGILLLMFLASWLTTPARVREANEYSWAPIREVAILFAGIFVTMIPALAMLRAGERGALASVIRAVRDPAHFFWASGILSSFLDNAPTYLTFLSTALGRLYPGAPEAAAVPRLVAEHHAYLRAIATGSVFMGANTYIGNAPNFMVKAIAEEAGVRMPSFFGYVVRYSVPVLVPVFAVATWAFFAGPAAR